MKGRERTTVNRHASSLSRRASHIGQSLSPNWKKVIALQRLIG